MAKGATKVKGVFKVRRGIGGAFSRGDDKLGCCNGRKKNEVGKLHSF